MENGLVQIPENNEIMGVTGESVKAMSAHLKAVTEFISSQLKQGIDNDYGIIPGTKKKVLFKPGAEKLMKLFHFSSTVKCIEKTVSPEENFAMFTYKAQVIHIKTGNVVAECEGVCNSMERKYSKMQAMDILNTLMKMAQKRALVGAVILATGASDYFTQDEDEIRAQNESQPVDATKFTRDVTPTGSDLGGFLVTFGKFEGKTFDEIGAKDLSGYLTWISERNQNPNGKMLELLNAGREYLRQTA